MSVNAGERFRKLLKVGHSPPCFSSRPPLMAGKITLDSLARKQKERVDAIKARDLPSGSASDDEGDFSGKITAAFAENDGFVTFTGYPEHLVRHWSDLMIPYALNARGRGPGPRSSLSDQLCCYLAYLHLDAEEPVLAKTLGIGVQQLSGNIERVRKILNETLKKKWPALAPRPMDDDQRPMAEVGALIDTITIECYRPKGRFGEVKHYFDGHHKVYGLKKEVMVTSARPHVCVEVSPYVPGSVGDYTYHCDNYERYTDYLTKTADERHWNGDDHRATLWGALCDKQYIGPQNDTPNERRITQKKGAILTAAEKSDNKKKSTTRVPIEQYFGRMVQKCGIMGGIYRYDHKNFDLDFENCCLLINEDISISNLAIGDGEYYQKFLAARVERWNERENKEKRSREKSKANKKAKLQKVQKYIGE